MCDIFKREFKLKNFGFRHSAARPFFTSQWKWHPVAFITYRVFVTLYSTACLLAVTISSIWSNDVHSIMAYLTIWTYTILCLYFLLSAAIVVFYWSQGRATSDNNLDAAVIVKARISDSKPAKVNGVISPAFETDVDVKGNSLAVGIVNTTTIDVREGSQNSSLVSEHSDRTNWCLKLSWLLSDVIYSFAIVVSVIYFVALFPSIGVQKGFIHDLNMHAFNSILVFIDVAITARPVRLLHVIYPIIYGTFYIIFSVVYWSQDKQVNVLYPGVLDWNYPGFTCIVIAVVCLIVLPVMQLAHFGLYRLRLLLYKNVYGTDYFEDS